MVLAGTDKSSRSPLSSFHFQLQKKTSDGTAPAASLAIFLLNLYPNPIVVKILKLKYKTMSNSVDSLFIISMNFVVKRINFVDSFVGFPALVGEQIFKTFVVQFDVKNNKSNEAALKKFVDAYGDKILKRLSLLRKLLVLNEHFESIIVISKYITELCVCSCSLGENHEIYSCISDFKCLKHLCLEDNSMTDSSMRRLTLRMRMYGTGGKEIEHLNLAENHLTDVMIPWLSAFPKLNYLNITGSKISVQGIKALKSRCNLKRSRSDGNHKIITNEGWASSLVQKWIDETLKERIRRDRNYYQKAIVSLVNFPCRRSELKRSRERNDFLVFEREPLLETTKQSGLPSAKRLALSGNFDRREIVNNLFSQYK